MKKISVLIKGFFKYWDLLKELVVRDIRVRYRRSYLGLIWTLLNPLLMMMVMTFVFSYLFISSIPNFPVYYLSAFILFNFCTESTNMALHAIVGNAALIKKVYIPKYLFPASKVLSCLVNLMFSFIAMLVVMMITGARFYPAILLSFVPIGYVFVFTLGLSLILSAITVFFRDIAHFYSVFTLAWMYLTPVFYPVSILPENLRIVLNFNPMFHFINFMRAIVLEGYFSSLRANLICASIATFTLLLGLVVFYRWQDKFILYV